MTSIKKYTIIFVALAGLTTAQFAIETLALDEFYWAALGVIMVVSTVKAVSVAGWYMHVFDEPRSITYLALAGVLGVVALTAGAAYSVTG
jgi:cytochrome c oxidase subunit 4